MPTGLDKALGQDGVLVYRISAKVPNGRGCVTVIPPEPEKYLALDTRTPDGLLLSGQTVEREGIRVTHLKKGPITVKDVYSIDPFNNEVVVYQMTGAQVKKYILNTYRKNGGYPSYVSGMTYRVSDDGSTVWINDANFSTRSLYKVAMNSYMASTVTIESEDDGRSTFMTSEEMMIEFLRKHKEVDYQGVVRTQ